MADGMDAPAPPPDGPPALRTRSIFGHVPHPHVAERRLQRPPTATDERIGINGRIGVFITRVVGTKWAAYSPSSRS